MTIRHQHELDGLRRAGALVSGVLTAMREQAAAGVTSRELDAYGAELMRKAGARPAPELTYGFPGATCISINAVAAHGIPDDTVLRDGDLVNIDVSAELDGYFADTGASFAWSAEPVSRNNACWTRPARRATRRSRNCARAAGSTGSAARSKRLPRGAASG